MHEQFMREALSLARRASAEGEVPVGCVVVRRDVIVGRGYNLRETTQSATAHAEILAIEEACRTTGFWRLEDCALYVTLEPCPMCAGAILGARLPRVFFGARDPGAGVCGSVLDLFAENLGHKPAVVGGLLAEESAALLQAFFQRLRAE